MFTEDLSVFYNVADFARPFIKLVAAQPGIAFNGIFSVVDEEALQGYAITAQYQLTYPTASVDLEEGDTLLDGLVTWQVRSEPRRVNDGLECVVLLSRTAA